MTKNKSIIIILTKLINYKKATTKIRTLIIISTTIAILITPICCNSNRISSIINLNKKYSNKNSSSN